MRALAPILVSFALVAGGASAGVANDEETVQALVMAKRDVPSYWTATIIADPCPSTTMPAAGGAVRAATRWGGLSAGIWSVAFVAPTSRQARVLFRQITASLPRCVATFWRTHAFAPGATPATTKIVARPIASFDGEHERWRVSVFRERTPASPLSLDVVVVRRGRAVAQYVYGWDDGLSAIRHAVARA